MVESRLQFTKGGDWVYLLEFVLLLTCTFLLKGARCSSVVECLLTCDGSSDRSLMVDPLNYFSFQSVLHTTGVTKVMVCAILSVG